MTTLRSFLAPLTLALAAVVVAPSVGCTGRAVLVSEDPPPARYERVSYRPGHVWVKGHWERHGRHWKWQEGRYERERPGHIYVEGRWQRSDHGTVWVDGGWRRHTVTERRYRR